MEKILLILFSMEVVHILEMDGLLQFHWNVRLFSYKLKYMALPGKEGNNPRTLINYCPVFVVSKWKQDSLLSQ